MEAVEETLKGNTVHLLAKKRLPSLDLPKVSWLLVSFGRAGTCRQSLVSAVAWLLCQPF